MLYGIDCLAAAKYPKIAIESIPEGFAIGVFWDAFGPAKKFITKACKSGKFPLIRIQGIWRDDHRFRAIDFKRAIDIGIEVQKIAGKFPNIDIQYSPFCEHDQKKLKMEGLFRDLKMVVPEVQLVNSPVKSRGGEFVTNAINEIHNHDAPSGFKKERLHQFSFDGVHAPDADITKYKNKYEDSVVFFFWSYQFNRILNEEEAKKKIPREKRTCKPTKKYIQSNAAFSAEKLFDMLDPGWLWKSHAEQQSTNDPRAGSVVLLGPVECEYVDCRHVGKHIARLYYVSKSKEGDHIYRTKENLFGFEMKKMAGGAVSLFLSTGACIGTVDPAFRCGRSFRE